MQRPPYIDLGIFDLESLVARSLSAIKEEEFESVNLMLENKNCADLFDEFCIFFKDTIFDYLMSISTEFRNDFKENMNDFLIDQYTDAIIAEMILKLSSEKQKRNLDFISVFLDKIYTIYNETTRKHGLLGKRLQTVIDKDSKIGTHIPLVEDSLFLFMSLAYIVEGVALHDKDKDKSFLFISRVYYYIGYLDAKIKQYIIYSERGAKHAKTKYSQKGGINKNLKFKELDEKLFEFISINVPDGGWESNSSCANILFNNFN